MILRRKQNGVCVKLQRTNMNATCLKHTAHVFIVIIIWMMRITLLWEV